MTTPVTHPAVQARVSKWLGVLPHDWSGARLCQVAEAWTSNVDKHTVEGQPAVRLCNYTDVYKNSSITSNLDFMKATATAEQIVRFRIRRGDTIITKDSETADDIGIPAYVEYEADDLICGYHLAIVRPDPRAVAPRFLYWVMVSSAVQSQWRVLASGVTRVGLRSTDLTKATIPLPPAADQLAIADILDRETAQIDALISKQHGLIKVLRERRSALLDQHFQSSEGKRSASIRQTLMKLTRPAPSGLGVVTAYRDGVVTLRSNRREDGYTFSETEAGYQEVLPGDIVFHALDGFAGAVGVSDSHGVCTPVYHVCRPRGDDDPEYLALLLRYLGTSGFLAVQAPNVRQRSVDFRNWSTFARVPLMLPSPDEQRAFMADYRARKASVDALIAKTQQHIAFAKERRAALISAAVTGQIDVAGRSAA
ncbi:restriction endonuclease subunit S [Micromonospora sp. NPDC052213]|uniref:restriction endonuclease subunit S n=1 Tax=Micromonospora sp. NPDC052213 TaxID=3155812 RepID=UPI0034186B8D